MANVPTEAFGSATRIKDEEATPPKEGVTGETIEKLTLVGAVPTHEAERVTAELKSFNESIVIVTDPVLPAANVTRDVDDTIEKSAEAVPDGFEVAAALVVLLVVETTVAATVV